MNLLDCVVTKILSEPFYEYGKWFLKVEYKCYGNSAETSLMFREKQYAEQVEIGYKFQS